MPSYAMWKKGHEREFDAYVERQRFLDAWRDAAAVRAERMRDLPVIVNECGRPVRVDPETAQAFTVDGFRTRELYCPTTERFYADIGYRYDDALSRVALDGGELPQRGLPG